MSDSRSASGSRPDQSDSRSASGSRLDLSDSRSASGSRPDQNRHRQLGAHALRGFAMGTADLVPGVSGGTIALVLGIYERLIGAVRDGAAVLAEMLRADVTGARRRFVAIEWRLVAPVLAGIGVAVASLAAVLTHLLGTYPREMSAVFFGLIVGSIAVTVRDVGRRDAIRVTTGLVTAGVTFALLGLSGAPTQDPALIAVFAAGAVAICGMILPGVSGAFILLMLGMYETTLAAVTGFDVAFVAVLGLGAVTGLALFGSALKWLLERYHDTMMAALIGLMGGSLRVLWPWPGEEVGDPRMAAPVVADLPVAVAGAVLAAILVYVLGSLGRPPGARPGIALRGEDPRGSAAARLRGLLARLRSSSRLDVAAPIAVALGVAVTLGVLRVWAPSVLRSGDGGDVVAFAAIPLVVALATAPAAVALIGVRRLALAGAALLVVGRFALPATGGGQAQLAVATVAVIGALVWLAAIAGGAVPRRAAAIGVVAGIALDGALLVSTGSLDPVWRTDTAAIIAGAAVLAGFAATTLASARAPAPDDEHGDAAPVWAWLAVGPTLALVVSVGTPMRLTAADVDAAVAGSVVVAGHLVAVLAAVAVARNPTALQGPVASGLVVLGLAGAIAARMPFETPPILAGSTALLLVGIGVATARTLVADGRRSSAVRAGAAVVGIALGATLVAAHHLLHVPGVLTGAAAIVVAVALLTARDRTGSAAVAGARVAVTVVAIAGMVGAGTVLTGPAPAAPTGPATFPVRVAGYHLDGALDRDGRAAVDRLARTIAAQRPDVVVLQGVDRGRFAAGGIDVLPHLAARLDMAAVYAPAESVQLGVALLTRHGLLDSRAEPLPATGGAPGASAVLALVDLGDGRAVAVVTTRLHDHFGASGVRRQQATRLAQIVDGIVAARTPVVVVGDLGAPPHADELAPLHRSLTNLSRTSPPTSPAHDPTEVRQQVLTSIDLAGHRLTVDPEVISDHLMVAVTIERSG